MKKRLSGLLLSLALVLTMMPVMSTPVYAEIEDYPLWIKGTQVTSENMKDVLGDGNVSYDPDAGTLKLDGADITADPDHQYTDSAIYYEGREKDLTINAAKASTVTASGDDAHGIYTVYKNLIFNGTLNVTSGYDGIDCNGDGITVNGKLTASGSEIGVYLDSGDITVNSGAELSAAGSNNSGIGVNDNTGSINIKEGAKVTAVGGKYGAISGVVKNAIAGTAWTDKDGTTGETAIEVNANRDLGDTYKKVQFPGKTDPAPAPSPSDEPSSASDPTAVGTTHAVDGSIYVVTAPGTVSLVKAAGKKSYTVPGTVQLCGKIFTVTGIQAKAFRGTKVKTLTVRTRMLTKRSVKGSLRGSKVKTVKVKVGKKKVNKKYVRKYKKIFTKKNCGKKFSLRDNTNNKMDQGTDPWSTFV